MKHLGVACRRAIRLYCAGISHGQVSATIPNANFFYLFSSIILLRSNTFFDTFFRNLFFLIIN